MLLASSRVYKMQQKRSVCCVNNNNVQYQTVALSTIGISRANRPTVCAIVGIRRLLNSGRTSLLPFHKKISQRIFPTWTSISRQCVAKSCAYAIVYCGRNGDAKRGVVTFRPKYSFDTLHSVEFARTCYIAVTSVAWTSQRRHPYTQR